MWAKKFYILAVINVNTYTILIKDSILNLIQLECYIFATEKIINLIFIIMIND